MKKTLLFAAMAASLSLTACKKETPQTLELDSKKMEFAKGNDTKSFNITSNMKWKIEALGLETAIGANIGEGEWYTVEPVFGEGNAKITITSKENSEGGKATLKIKFGNNEEKSVELSQK